MGTLRGKRSAEDDDERLGMLYGSSIDWLIDWCISYDRFRLIDWLIDWWMDGCVQYDWYWLIDWLFFCSLEKGLGPTCSTRYNFLSLFFLNYSEMSDLFPISPWKFQSVCRPTTRHSPCGSALELASDEVGSLPLFSTELSLFFPISSFTISIYPLLFSWKKIFLSRKIFFLWKNFFFMKKFFFS